MKFIHGYCNLVVKNVNFTLLLTSTGQEWQVIHGLLAMTSSGQVVKNGNFTLLLTSSGQECKLYMATDI